MQKHISNTELLNIAITGTMPDHIATHLEDCERCAGNLVMIQKVYAARPADSAAPSTNVRDRIIAAAQSGAYRDREKVVTLRSNIGTRKFIAAAASIGIIIPAVVYLVLQLTRPGSRGAAEPVAITGQVQSAIEAGATPARIAAGSVIRANGNSPYLLSADSYFSVQLSRGELTVLTTGRDSQANPVFAFQLSNGSIQADFNEAIRQAYSFRTPQGLIFSGGTEFELSADANATVVKLFKGSLNYRSDASANNLSRLTAGRVYTITASGITSEELPSLEKPDEPETAPVRQQRRYIREFNE